MKNRAKKEVAKAVRELRELSGDANKVFKLVKSMKRDWKDLREEDA